MEPAQLRHLSFPLRISSISLRKLSPIPLLESKPWTHRSLSSEIPLNAWTEVTDGSVKMKPNGVLQTVAALHPQHQQNRTRSGHSHSTQWSELQATQVVLANTLLDESCCIFTDSWNVVKNQLFGLSLRKTIEWKIRHPSSGSWTMETDNKAIDQTSWVTHIDAHSKGLFSHDTNCNQIRTTASIIALDMATHPPSQTGNTVKDSML